MRDDAIDLPRASASGIKRTASCQGSRVLAIVRLFVIVAVLAIVGFGSMIALVQLVEPEPRDYSVTVPPSIFNK